MPVFETGPLKADLHELLAKSVILGLLRYDEIIEWRPSQPSNSLNMLITVEERSLSERLKPRMAVEEQFARTGRGFRHKPFIIRHEKVFVRPWLKLGLQALGLYSRGVRNALSPVIRNVKIYSRDLPPAFDGFEMLHISDFHIDGVDGLAERLTNILENLRPDLCVLAGDYRFEDNGSCDDVYPRMRRILSSIHARHGVFGILGNHDISDIAFALEEMGVRMLINEAIEIRERDAAIWLAGLDDSFDYRCDDLPGTLAAVPCGAFKILLSHTPELYAQASAHGVDLYLCGHTHAGQIRFPHIGSLRHNAKCPKEYSYGQWQFQEMQGYTSSGIGCSSLPVRFNCPPELALIELRHGPAR